MVRSTENASIIDPKSLTAAEKPSNEERILTATNTPSPDAAIARVTSTDTLENATRPGDAKWFHIAFVGCFIFISGFLITGLPTLHAWAKAWDVWLAGGDAADLIIAIRETAIALARILISGYGAFTILRDWEPRDAKSTTSTKTG